jgi:hypothetical protein
MKFHQVVLFAVSTGSGFATRTYLRVSMLVFHELVVPGLVQFVTPENKDWWKKNSATVPGPQTDRLCEMARKSRRWPFPGSMWEIDGDNLIHEINCLPDIVDQHSSR